MTLPIASTDNIHSKMNEHTEVPPRSQPGPRNLISDKTETTERVCAVIITYFPSDDLPEAVDAVLEQVSHVLIVDNGSQPKRGDVFERLEKDHVTIFRIRENLGIATALNLGVNWARDHGFQWVLTLDQDSLCLPGMVAKMLEAYRQEPNREKIGILAPVHFDRDTNHVSLQLRNLPTPVVDREIVMSSGNLVPLHVYDQIGQYDDDLFIEYVDTDFCLRMKSRGYRAVLVRDARLGHRLGDQRRHRVGPWWGFFSHNYMPVRRYYRARNRVILYRRFKTAWIFRDQNFAIRDFIKILLVEELRWEKIKATFMGTFDALLGRLGRFEGVTFSTPKATHYYGETRDEIVPLLPPHSERVLDLGCGAGEVSAKQKSLGRFGWVCGVEGNPEVAKIAEQKLDRVLVGDIEKMEYPFPDGHFDTVLTLDILEHLVDPWRVLEQIHRLLKPKGRLVVSIPNMRHYSVTVPLLLFGDFRYQQEFILDSTHLRFFTKRTIIKTLESAGFEIELMDYTGAKHGLGAKANKLTLGLFKDFFIFQNLIACKKVEQSNKRR